MVAIIAALRIFERLHKENMTWLSITSSWWLWKHTIYIVRLYWREGGGVREKYTDRKQHWILSYAINYERPMTELQMEKNILLPNFLKYFHNINE